MIKKVTIVYTPMKAKAVGMASELSKRLSDLGVENEVLDSERIMEIGSKIFADLVITLGGDGTILRSIHSLADHRTPILGVNFGRGGYLAELDPEEVHGVLDSVLKENFEVEEVMKLSVYAENRKLGDVVNEVYVSGEYIGKVVEFEIVRGSYALLEGVADGVIIATPLGSTAYAMSAGGPAVDHKLNVVVVVPVCPLTRMSPLVLPVDGTITLRLKAPRVHVLIDGQIREILDKERLIISKSEQTVRFVRVKRECSFARRLRKRLR
ncbi:MAG: NAD(+)/NADH kinase [Thaumarchaeota archaeon]|nr:NAD(+)/NADH kinase [Candidatus Terraquivivens yellowstonensis]MCL7387364.1 NAD(+)/NADH kinase [Candidatus Terraquivivens yellowstonensis]MCL7392022.1 NAD(+)/NADH kinase [Candidatus Terraquivivens yellowstonensis]MCL7394984.1 NAD(+)/NADH kinase [Candidatus Terraquivivens yellowstonensis]MCL7397778.1 NAD(+)/NADH kinase [Candidatus Terraquivivens yellowstonensis]